MTLKHRARAAFSAVDKKRRGFIAISELGALLQMLGLTASAPLLVLTQREMGVGGAGQPQRITFSQLVSWMRHHEGAAHGLFESGDAPAGNAADEGAGDVLRWATSERWAWYQPPGQGKAHVYDPIAATWRVVPRPRPLLLEPTAEAAPSRRSTTGAGNATVALPRRQQQRGVGDAAERMVVRRGSDGCVRVAAEPPSAAPALAFVLERLVAQLSRHPGSSQVRLGCFVELGHRLARAPRLDTAAFAAALHFVAPTVDLDSRDVRDVFAFAKATCERDGVRRLCAAGLLRALCGDASRHTRAAALALFRRCARGGLVSVEAFEGAFDARRHPDVLAGHISMEQAQVDLRSALNFAGAPLDEAAMLQYFTCLEAAVSAAFVANRDVGRSQRFMQLLLDAYAGGRQVEKADFRRMASHGPVEAENQVSPSSSRGTCAVQHRRAQDTSRDGFANQY